jgi:hypothetical protein
MGWSTPADVDRRRCRVGAYFAGWLGADAGLASRSSAITPST